MCIRDRQNRGANFSLDETMENCIGPGKKSYHTIIPSFLSKDGKMCIRDRICAVLIGNNIDHLAQECFEYGAEKVYMVQDPLLENYTTDAYTKVCLLYTSWDSM